MPHRHTSFYRCRHQELIAKLGGVCVMRGQNGHSVYACLQELHVDHVEGRDWEPRELSSNQRIRRYWREYEAGVKLQVLCKYHNTWAWQQRRREKKGPWDRRAKKSPRSTSSTP